MIHICGGGAGDLVARSTGDVKRLFEMKRLCMLSGGKLYARAN